MGSRFPGQNAGCGWRILLFGLSAIPRIRTGCAAGERRSEVVWPKNTVCTAAAVAALAQCASSPRFQASLSAGGQRLFGKGKTGLAIPDQCHRAIRFLNGSHEKIQHFGDDFTHRDELAWAACEMYLATADTQYQTEAVGVVPGPDRFERPFKWGEDGCSRVTAMRFGIMRSRPATERSRRSPIRARLPGEMHQRNHQLRRTTICSGHRRTPTEPASRT